MRNLLFTITLMVMTSSVFAQSSQLTNAWAALDDGDYRKAKIAVDKAAAHEKTSMSPKMFFYKGETYYYIGADTTGQFNDINKDAYYISVEAFFNALKYQDKKTDVNKINAFLSIYLYNGIWDMGVAKVSSKEFAEASKAFATCAQIRSSYDQMDTLAWFYAGNFAQAGKDYDAAIAYFDTIKNTGYNNGEVYDKLASIYKAQGDTAKSLAIIDEGITNHPDNLDLIIAKANTYIIAGETEKAIAMIKAATDADPTNPNLWFTSGVLKRDMGDIEGAEQDLLKSAELDSNNADVYEELGALFVNKAVKLTEKKNALPFEAQKEYDALTAEINGLYEKALPYLKKAYAINPESRVKETLMQLYLRNNDMENYNKIKEGK